MSHGFLPGAFSIASTPAGGPNAGFLEEGRVVKIGKSRKQATTTIDMLPDDVVLHIFDFYRIMDLDPNDLPCHVWRWNRLTHICQRWRQIVFASPRRLGLQIYCTHRTPAREVLRCWPALPIVIDFFADNESSAYYALPVEALKHPDRVCSIRIDLLNFLFEEMAEVMENPFPILESLTLHSMNASGDQALPDAFLGGHTPRLQQVILNACPFPIFPRFLRSSRDLVTLRLLNISQNRSISAVMMVAGLAELTKLESLVISFDFPYELRWHTSHPDQIFAAPPTRTVFPALTRFFFLGARSYMEEFVAQIETPRLTDLRIIFFALDRVVQVPELFQFICRAEYLKLAEFRRARIDFHDIDIKFRFDCPQMEPHHCVLNLTIRSHYSHWQASMTRLLSQFLGQSSLNVSNVRDLSIATRAYLWVRDNNENPTEWLAFLCQFAAVETLRTYGPLAGIVATALEDSTTDMVTEVLPALQFLKLMRHPLTSGALEGFIAARGLSGRPVTVYNQADDTGFQERPEFFFSPVPS